MNEIRSGPEFPQFFPQTPLLKRLKADICGYQPKREMSVGIMFLNYLVYQYRHYDIPFIVVNMGIPTSGKTTLAGEELARAASSLSHLATPEKPLRDMLAYIPYESVQRVVEQEGEVEKGHGPGNQTQADHRISSRRLGEEVRKSLESGQNIILEAPFIAGRGSKELLADLAQHRGEFAGLTYNVKFMWPIPSQELAQHTRLIRTEYDRRDREEVLQANNTVIHGDTGTIPGAGQHALRSNFYPDLREDLFDLYQYLKGLGFAVKPVYDMIVTDAESFVSTGIMLQFLQDSAPALLQSLGIKEHDIAVCTNDIVPQDTPVHYYGSLMKSLNKFS